MSDIRQLGPDDLDTCRALLAMFADAFEDADNYLGKPPSDAYLAALLRRDTFIALASIESGSVGGGLVAYELEKLEQARSEIYIYDLAVAAPYRRRGLATRLIERLGVIARSRGTAVIFVQADYADPPAIALYTKLGQREEVLHFDIPPAEPSS